jgi:hypothetical protein
LDGTLKVENVSDWVEDANDSGILYHDGLKIRGVLKTAAPGGKGKSRVAFADSAGKGSESTHDTAYSTYRFVGVLKADWRYHEHTDGGKNIKLWKREWKETGGYFYHDRYMLQAKAP